MTGRLVVVDDDVTFGRYMQTRLSARGYDVALYHCGASFLESLRQPPPPSVVLLDVLMPGVDGLETLKQVRQVQPSAQVIMLSGQQAPATIVEALRLGAVDFVPKSADPGGGDDAILEAAIRQAIDRDDLGVVRSGLAEGGLTGWSTDGGMQQVMAMIEGVADTDVNVLLRGESGVGKEVVAREILRRSPRRSEPFVKVNCAALPADLLESELFGHERGAFTGATQTRIGRFEFTNRGTLMLDEIGETPLALQAKLLHVLQDGELTRLGSNRPVIVDVRVIAATNRDLPAMIRAGTFREDLYYRLQVIEIVVPPLRERIEEIHPLSDYFLKKYARLHHRRPIRTSPALRAALVRYSWPGNVRELENMMQRLVVLQDEAYIFHELARQTGMPGRLMALQVPAPAVDAWGAGADVDMDPAAHATLQDVARAAARAAERDAIAQALERFRWNRRKAAAFLNISYKTMLNKMKDFDVGAFDIDATVK